MYSSLDRIDLVAQNKEGVTQYYQTDHRTEEEVAAQVELSTLFALSRCLNPHRFAESQDYEVLYSCQHHPPRFLIDIIKNCDCKLEVDGKLVDPPASELDLKALVNESYATLARKLKLKCLDTKSLHMYEKKVFKKKLSGENNEIEYWENIFELAAAAGEVLKGQAKGRWKMVEGEQYIFGAVPMYFEVDTGDGTMSVNLPGKARKLIDHGLEDSIAGLVENVTRRVSTLR